MCHVSSTGHKTAHCSIIRIIKSCSYEQSVNFSTHTNTRYSQTTSKKLDSQYEEKKCLQTGNKVTCNKLILSEYMTEMYLCNIFTNEIIPFNIFPQVSGKKKKKKNPLQHGTHNQVETHQLRLHIIIQHTHTHKQMSVPTATLTHPFTQHKLSDGNWLENFVTGQHSLPLSLSPVPQTLYCVCVCVRLCA